MSRIDRGARDLERNRRQGQRNSEGLGSTYAGGLLFDPDTGTVVVRIGTGQPFTTVSGLALTLTAASGLAVASSALAVSLATASGLVLSAGGLAVSLDTNPGLVLGASGLAVSLDTDPGLVLSASGLAVSLDTDPGLVLGASGLAVSLDTNPGLVLGAGGLAVSLDGVSLAKGASGLSVAAPEGSFTVTTIQTGAFTAAAGQLVRCDPTAGVFTVTLPTAVGIAGRQVVVKNTTSDTTAITVDGNAAETIDGSTSIDLTTAFGLLRLVSDGAGWLQI